MAVCPTVYPDRKTRLPLDGFKTKMVFENFYKNCGENSSWSKNWEEQWVFYIMTSVYLWQLAELS